LHDIVGQQLTGVSLLLGAVQQRLDASGAGNEQTSDLLHTARQQLDEAFDAARALSRRLDGFATPSRAIEDADRLIESGAPCGRVVRAMVADADRRFGVGVRVRAEIGVDLDALRGPWVSEIVSIAREAVTNAVRHGRATRVHVLLFTDGARGVLEIVDDGRGISLSLSRFAMDGTRVHARATGDDARDSPAAADHDDATSGITHDRSAAGLGLKMMRDRAEGLGGVLTLGTWRDERGGLRGERGGFVRLTWPLHDSARYGDDSGDFRGILSSSPRASAEESRDQA
jgi:nitrate/nitrite-specific signal transduction histidine kinase